MQELVVWPVLFPAPPPSLHSRRPLTHPPLPSAAPRCPASPHISVSSPCWALCPILSLLHLSPHSSSSSLWVWGASQVQGPHKPAHPQLQVLLCSSNSGRKAATAAQVWQRGCGLSVARPPVTSCPSQQAFPTTTWGDPGPFPGLCCLDAWPPSSPTLDSRVSAQLLGLGLQEWAEVPPSSWPQRFRTASPHKPLGSLTTSGFKCHLGWRHLLARRLCCGSCLPLRPFQSSAGYMGAPGQYVMNR